MSDDTKDAAPSERRQIDLVLDRFGTIRQVHLLTGIPYNTIQAWQRSGWIPSRYHHDIIQAAQRARVPLTADELIRPWTAEAWSLRGKVMLDNEGDE